MAQGRVSRFYIWALVWRSSRGVCKVYAYVPRDNNICKDSGIQCNDEFGISISRGSFTFSSGQYVIHILSSS